MKRTEPRERGEREEVRWEGERWPDWVPVGIPGQDAGK